MRILFINSVCGIRSTGRICTDLATELEAQGHECKIAYGRVDEVPEKFQKYALRIGTDMDLKLHALKTRLFDRHGFGSKKATKAFLRWADEFDPQLLWLHNLHGYYINIELLFDWIKSRPHMEVKWTLHDCWAFTGHCPHFTVANCSRWKSGCRNCPQKRGYPSSILLDNSRQNYLRKKAAFCGVKSMSLISPSNWLAGLVKQSFLKDYPLEVCYNTVDREVFKPRAGNFRAVHNLEDKKIVLGVSSMWDERKGLYDFFKLADMLSDNWRIVLVGLSDAQLKDLKPNILGFPRTNNTRELAEIYSAADVFFNPSIEETFGMTSLEAMCCGTKAIVYENTACEEVANMLGGIVMPRDVSAVHSFLERMQ